MVYTIMDKYSDINRSLVKPLITFKAVRFFIDHYLWQSLSYIGQWSHKMDSSENFTNFQAGIKIKNVPWLDKRFNKLRYMLLIDDFKSWHKTSITNIVRRNFLIHHDKSLLSFQVETYKIAEDSYDNLMSLYVNTSREMPLCILLNCAEFMAVREHKYSILSLSYL